MDCLWDAAILSGCSRSRPGDGLSGCHATPVRVRPAEDVAARSGSSSSRRSGSNSHGNGGGKPQDQPLLSSAIGLGRGRVIRPSVAGSAERKGGPDRDLPFAFMPFQVVVIHCRPRQKSDLSGSSPDPRVAGVFLLPAGPSTSTFPAQPIWPSNGPPGARRRGLAVSRVVPVK
jgi:hypothetical protein